MPRSHDAKRAPGGRPAFFRNGDGLCAREILPGQRFLGREDGIWKAGRDDVAAACSGPRAKVHQVVRGPHGLFVVFHDEDGVAHVAQPFEAREQAGIVARVEADAWLVENVKDADQSRADLAREANALRFAPRERWRGAIEGEIVQPNIQEEAKPIPNLLQQLPGDHPRSWSQSLLVFLEPRHQIANRHLADFHECFAADADSAGLGIEPLSLTGRAAHHAHVLFKLHPSRTSCRLLELLKQLGNDSFPFPAMLPDLAAALLPFPDDVGVAASIEKLIPRLSRQLLPGQFEIDSERFANALEDVPPPSAHALERANNWNRAVVNADGWVGNNQVRIKRELVAQAIALRTHPLGIVEAEELWRGRFVTEIAGCAGIVGRKEKVLG